jgi:hypothetical protein
VVELAEFGKAIPRGGLATLASAIKGPVALFDVGDDSALYKGITDFEKYRATRRFSTST